jgi:hypothetical protein
VKTEKTACCRATVCEKQFSKRKDCFGYSRIRRLRL